MSSILDSTANLALPLMVLVSFQSLVLTRPFSVKSSCYFFFKKKRSDELANVSVSDGDNFICEIQLVRDKMLLQRKGMGGHDAYDHGRGCIEALEAIGETFTQPKQPTVDEIKKAMKIRQDEILQNFQSKLDKEAELRKLAEDEQKAMQEKSDNLVAAMEDEHKQQLEAVRTKEGASKADEMKALLAKFELEKDALVLQHARDLADAEQKNAVKLQTEMEYIDDHSDDQSGLAHSAASVGANVAGSGANAGRDVHRSTSRSYVGDAAGRRSDTDIGALDADPSGSFDGSGDDGYNGAGGADGGNRDAWGAGVATGVDSSSSAGSSSEAEMVEVELTKVAGKEGHSAGFGFKFETFRDTGTFIFLVKPGLPAAESEQMSRGQRILTVNGTSVSGLIKPDLRTKFRQAGSTLRLALASDAQSYAGRRVSKAPFGGIGCPATLTATFAVAGQNSGVVLAGAPGVGVYVHSVDIDSAAAQTGLLAYTMRVVSINSRDVGTATTPTEAMAWMSQYSACTLVLQHDRLGYRSFLLNDKAASSSRSGQNNGSSSVRYQPPNIKWLFSRSLGSSTGV